MVTRDEQSERLEATVDSAGDISITGSPAELRRFESFLKNKSESKRRLEIDGAQGSDSVEAIEVRIADHRLSIGHGDAIVWFEGRQEHLDLIADTTSRLANDQYQSPHVHIEYYESHPFLAEDAVPLILARSDLLRKLREALGRTAQT